MASKNDFVSIQEAVTELSNGNVVAVPTETVYGLAARIDDENAVRKIFSTKQRPFFDPLIVHVGSVDQARSCVSEWSDVAEILAEAFWPGPLALILPKSDQVSDLITSGLQTVAVRWPKHKVTQELLEQIAMPVAAPSANRFGKTSPTRPQHVLSEYSGEVAVIDGGDCEVGIESTLLDISKGVGELKILRPGMISKEKILAVLSDKFPEASVSEVSSGAQAPGQMENHYMPERPLVVVSPEQLKDEDSLIERVNKELKTDFESFVELSLSEDVEQAARELYASLREASQSEASFIVYSNCLNKGHNSWAPIKNRISRAQSLVLCENFTAESEFR